MLLEQRALEDVKRHTVQKQKKPDGHSATGRVGSWAMLRTTGRSRFESSDHQAGAELLKRVLKRRESQAVSQRGFENLINFRQYSVFDQPQGYCGRYNL